MAFTGIPRVLAEWVASLAPHKYTLIAILAGIYILLGTALDGISMIVLTTSVVIPMVEKAGFDWSGSASSSCCWWRSPSSPRRSASTSSCSRP
jgi:TRAP-type C4-dicarboxylate transport system permease large subunit